MLFVTLCNNVKVPQRRLLLCLPLLAAAVSPSSSLYLVISVPSCTEPQLCAPYRGKKPVFTQ